MPFRAGDDAHFVHIGDVNGGAIDPHTLARGAAPARSLETALKSGDVLVSIKGRANNAVLFTGEACHAPIFASSDVAVVTPHPEKVRGDYIAWLFRLPKFQDELQRGQAGTAAQRLSLKALREIEIPLPPLDVQHAIAGLDQTLERERVLTERLLENRTALFSHLAYRLASEGRQTKAPLKKRSTPPLEDSLANHLRDPS